VPAPVNCAQSPPTTHLREQKQTAFASHADLASTHLAKQGLPMRRKHAQTAGLPHIQSFQLPPRAQCVELALSHWLGVQIPAVRVCHVSQGNTQEWQAPLHALTVQLEPIQHPVAVRHAHCVQVDQCLVPLDQTPAPLASSAGQEQLQVQMALFVSHAPWEHMAMSMVFQLASSVQSDLPPTDWEQTQALCVRHAGLESMH
jgi:hypothetical protein